MLFKLPHVEPTWVFLWIRRKICALFVYVNRPFNDSCIAFYDSLLSKKQNNKNSQNVPNSTEKGHNLSKECRASVRHYMETWKGKREHPKLPALPLQCQVRAQKCSCVKERGCAYVCLNTGVTWDCVWICNTSAKTSLLGVLNQLWLCNLSCVVQWPLAACVLWTPRAPACKLPTHRLRHVFPVVFNRLLFLCRCNQLSWLAER